MVQCLVQLLDGTDYELEIDKKATGQELMDKVCEKLNLVERDFFGLTYIQSHIKFWMSDGKQISKQIKKGPWHVAFELKFYPDPMMLQEEITRYQVYQQIRRDILSGKLPCSFVALALLSSYAVQSQLGDYNPEQHGNSSDYLKGLEFSPGQNDELLERIAELHKTHRGQTPSEAELYYLDNAKNLALYGVHMHEAKEMDGDDVNIGVCAVGLLIYKDRIRVSRYTWPKIIKIRYKRNVFYVDIRPDQPDEKMPIVSYKLSNVKMAKRLWRISVEHHAFFRLREPESASRSMFSRAPYRYTGRTLYQTQRAAAQMDRSNPEFSRATGGAQFTGSRSMENINLGYSTERWEKHMADDPRTTTIDLRHQRSAGGSLADLNQIQLDPTIEGQVSLLVGDNRATYRPMNGSPGYQPVGSLSGSQSAVGRYPQYMNTSHGYPGSDDDSSMASHDRRVDHGSGQFGTAPGTGTQRWNGLRPDSVSSDASSSVQRPPRRKRVTSRDSQQSSQSSDRGGRGRHHSTDMEPGYSTLADAAAADNWTPHSPNSLNKTSTRTYAAPDGSIVTEYRTERNGVIETHIEKRTRIASVQEEDVDHDKELTDAIFAVTDMDPHMSVQKIEIHTRAEEV